MGIWSLNIFVYTNLALGNNYTFSKALIQEIRLFVLNLTEEHLVRFNKNFPYLSRKLARRKPRGNQATAIVIPAPDKYEKWQETANKIHAKNSKLTKKNIAAQVFDELKTSAPQYIMKSESEFHTINSILRQINMPKNATPKKAKP